MTAVLEESGPGTAAAPAARRSERLDAADPPPRGRGRLRRFFQQEDLNFLLTNRIPRRFATLAMGRLSRLEWPWLTALMLRIWRLFADDLNLAEAKQRRFRSLHECFVRELVPGARPIDTRPEVFVSPCDAVVGEGGAIEGRRVFQAKGFPYALEDLLPDPELAERYVDGQYVTLRLKSTMYHRFHAPHDGRIRQVTYVSGDTWNVNPIALQRVEKLFCKNERAVLDLELDDPICSLTLVPVAAVLVASMKFHCLDEVLDLRYRGPNRIACDQRYRKGDELGYFQHGSTIIVFVRGDVELAPDVRQGRTIRMGEPLFIVKGRTAGGTTPNPASTSYPEG